MAVPLFCSFLFSQQNDAFILVDFGPNDVTNGNITSNPDINGNYWNNVVNVSTSADTVHFVDNLNNAAGSYLLITSTFNRNGILNGGLLVPDSALLGHFAVPTATQDYFFSETSASLALGGLDISKGYIFSFFATRNSREQRITEYEVKGANSSVITLQTSATDLGGPGYHGNTQTIAVTDPVAPDANGTINITMSKISGTFCYLGIMKMEATESQGKFVLENTGFEEGNLNNWRVAPEENESSSSITSENAQSGQYALKLTADSLEVSQSITAVSADEYVLSGYFYNPSADPLRVGQSALLALSFYDSSEILLESRRSQAVMSGTEQDTWHKISLIALVPPNTQYIEARIIWNGSNDAGGGTVYCDNINLEIFDEVVSSCTAVSQFYEEAENSVIMETAFDDQNWPLYNLPVDESNLLHSNRTYWFRKTIDVPANMAADTSFSLRLLQILGIDAVWINGTLINEPAFANNLRNYPVPDTLVREGQMVIVIQTGFTGETGFFNYYGLHMQLRTLSNPENNVSIEGAWRYQQGVIFTNDNPVQQENKIVFMGSSVANGQGATGNMGYAYQYSQLLSERFDNGLGAEWEAVNVSIGGNNTIDVMNRYDRDLIPECPKYVIYGLSLGNEGIHENGQSAFDQFNENLQLLVEQAKDDGIQPVVINCYTRSDFTAADYDFTRQMNLLIHGWDVPSVNVLGTVDDGSGRWVEGYYADALHPNTAGHTEMFYSFVPSLFDALGQGKTTPQKVQGSFYTIENPHDDTPMLYTMDGIVHPFSVSFDFRTAEAGDIAGLSTESAHGFIKIDSLDGSVSYISPAGQQITSSFSLSDNNWHKITLSHYYARAATFFYVDTFLIGTVSEQLQPQQFVLGGSGYPGNHSPESIDYREWLFYRSALNRDEIIALNNGALLKSSLELYAPLDQQGITGSDPFVNLAQSTTRINQNLVQGLREDADSVVPLRFGLFNNYPNPFNPSTTISYAIADNARVKLQVFNSLGEKITTLVNNLQMPGYYEVDFRSDGLASGIYFYTLNAGDFSEIKKMIFLK